MTARTLKALERAAMPTAIEVLKYLHADLKELDFEKVSDDGVTALVSKPAVFELIQDWREYCQEQCTKPSRAATLRGRRKP